MESLNETANADNSKLASTINEPFLLSVSDLSPLPNDFSLSINLDSNEGILSVTQHDVLFKYIKLSPTNVNGPDDISNWLLEKNTELLVDSVHENLNSSFRDTLLS